MNETCRMQRSIRSLISKTDTVFEERGHRDFVRGVHDTGHVTPLRIASIASARLRNVSVSGCSKVKAG